MQGLPEEHARIAGGKVLASGCPDGPQYRAYGEGYTRQVIEWLAGWVEATNRLRKS